jgi:hypothetical protein
MTVIVRTKQKSLFWIVCCCMIWRLRKKLTHVSPTLTVLSRTNDHVLSRTNDQQNNQHDQRPTTSRRATHSVTSIDTRIAYFSNMSSSHIISCFRKTDQHHTILLHSNTNNNTMSRFAFPVRSTNDTQRGDLARKLHKMKRRLLLDHVEEQERAIARATGQNSSNAEEHHNNLRTQRGAVNSKTTTSKPKLALSPRNRRTRVLHPSASSGSASSARRA